MSCHGSRRFGASAWHPKWVTTAPAKPFRLFNKDGSLAIEERLPRWIERSPATVEAGVSAAGAFGEALAARAPRPAKCTASDIRAQIRRSAASLDGLTCQFYGGLLDVQLERLAAWYSELDDWMLGCSFLGLGTMHDWSAFPRMMETLDLSQSCKLRIAAGRLDLLLFSSGGLLRGCRLS